MKWKNMDSQSLEGIAAMLKALAHPIRLQIMWNLHRGEQSVTELVKAVKSSQANVSKHLQLLSHVSLVKSRRDGNTIYYRVADPCVDKICDSVCQGYARILQQSLRKHSGKDSTFRRI